MAKVYIKGMKELEGSIKRLGKLPQKCVTKAARVGATIALKAARANAPIDIGNLRKGIILRGERSKTKGKKAYQVTLARSMNDIFQKTAVNAKVFRLYHGHDRKIKDPRYELKRYYYPASQEYGFKTKGGGYTPGFHYLKESITANSRAIEKTVVDVLAKEIDKELVK